MSKILFLYEIIHTDVFLFKNKAGILIFSLSKKVSRLLYYDDYLYKEVCLYM